MSKHMNQGTYPQHVSITYPAILSKGSSHRKKRVATRTNRSLSSGLSPVLLSDQACTYDGRW
eukprot:16447051-Heterocapsa_arctica.AAC.1